jgi:hypothetical protein
MSLCRKIKFTNPADAIFHGQRDRPQYKWKSYFCHVCIAWHMTRKRNHQGKGKPGRIQIRAGAEPSRKEQE